MSESRTERKILCLLCCINFRFCSIYYDNVFWFNIQLAKKSYRLQFFIFMQNVNFSFCLCWIWLPKWDGPKTQQRCLPVFTCWFVLIYPSGVVEWNAIISDNIFDSESWSLEEFNEVLSIRKQEYLSSPFYTGAKKNFLGSLCPWGLRLHWKIFVFVVLVCWGL